jgi:hypothetical protein
MAEEQDPKPQFQKASEAGRPSAGDYFGRPSTQTGNNNLAYAMLHATRDTLNWLVGMYLQPEQIARASRMLAKDSTRNSGRLTGDQMVFQLGMLQKSENGYSLNMYRDIAMGEQRRRDMLAQSWMNRMDAPPAAPPPGEAAK